MILREIKMPPDVVSCKSKRCDSLLNPSSQCTSPHHVPMVQLTSLTITWEEPLEPNGPNLNYKVSGLHRRKGCGSQSHVCRPTAGRYISTYPIAQGKYRSDSDKHFERPRNNSCPNQKKIKAYIGHVLSIQKIILFLLGPVKCHLGKWFLI